MNYPVPARLTPLASLSHPAVTIDWSAALAQRQMALAHDVLPRYLLGIEVGSLLHYVPDLYQQTLIATLWNTDARINEVLVLTRDDFRLDVPQSWVQTA